MRSQLPTVHAFHTLIRHGVCAQFPKLRFGFVEANSSWVPYVAYDLKRRLKRLPTGPNSNNPQYRLESDLLKANRMYVTCQADEDLPYILRFAGEDNLMIGSDYTHSDQSMESDFPRLLQERADRGELPQSAVQKILCDNARTLYGL
jgi:predicted TIM-barrel fold metal-dependent hydrolase